jgi:hypothetical protein
MMEITARDAVTVLHGMFFGALLLLSFSGAAAALYATSAARSHWVATSAQRTALSVYLAAMALAAWITVLLGAYVVYPWYRAVPPHSGTINLAGYPQRLLLSNPATAGWHSLGMEWKEHLAWLAPIGLTAAAYIVARYGAHLREIKALRNAVFGLVALAFFASSIAGFFGAMLNKNAPVRGGSSIELMIDHAHER